METPKLTPKVEEQPEDATDCLVRSPGGHVSSIEQIRAKGAMVWRSLGNAPNDSIPIIGDGSDLVDARPRPGIRRR